MKRSRSIRLVLLGGVSAGTLVGCGPGTPAVSTQDVFTNDHQVRGAGYYHAPFRAWYAFPYNHFDPATKRYYYGGQWGAAPHESAVNISTPSPEAVQRVAAQRTDVRRSGFGSTSRSHWVSS